MLPLPPSHDGPLWRYTRTAEQADQLQRALQGKLRHTDPATLDQRTAAAFCLFAAEWWQQNHRGGAWAWEGIQQALGIEEVPQRHLRDWTDRGLAFWGRSCFKTSAQTRYLDSLAIEAGFPTPLLEDHSSALHHAFARLLDHLEEADQRGVPLDESSFARLIDKLGALPERLQRGPVNQLTAAFLLALWPFVKEASADDEPRAWLEHNAHRWKDELPLKVELEVLHAFVVGVAETGARKRREATVQSTMACRLFEDSPGVFRIARSLRAPATLNDTAGTALFGEDAMQEPLIQVQIVGENTTIAGVYRRHGDTLYYDRHATQVPDVADDLVVQAVMRSGVHPIEALEGSGDLGDLPWLFTQHDGDWILQHSTTTPRTEARVALPANALIREGESRRIGSLDAHGREVFAFSGVIRVELPEGEVVLRTGTPPDNEQGALLFRGPRSDLRTRQLAYRGWPTLLRTGRALRSLRYDVYVDGIWVRPNHRFGRVRVRARDREGAPVLCQRITVVPDDLRIEVAPTSATSGTVTLRSSHLRGVSMTPALGVETTVAKTADGFQVEVAVPKGTPPTDLTVTLDLGGSALDVVVPMPIAVRGFQRADGRRLDPGDTVHIGALENIRAHVIDRRSGDLHQLKLKVGTRVVDTVPLRAEGRVHTLDLLTLQQRLRAILARQPGLDAAVEVHLTSPGVVVPQAKRPWLKIHRYDWCPDLDKATGIVVIPAATSPENVVVEARPFSAVHAADLLAPSPPGPHWDFAPVTRAPGPWLLTAAHEGWYRMRPTLWTVRGGTPPSSPLLAAMDQHEDQVRKLAIADALDALVDDLDHPDWLVVDRFLEASHNLPAVTFDLFVVLLAHPALHLALLRITWQAPRARSASLRALDGLPLCWHALPVARWRSAFDVYAEAMEEDAPGKGAEELTDAVLRLLPTVDLRPMLLLWLLDQGLVPSADVFEVAAEAENGDEHKMQVVRAFTTRHIDARSWPLLELPRPGPSLRIAHGRQHDPRMDAVVQAPMVAVQLALGSADPTPAQIRDLRVAQEVDDPSFRTLWRITLTCQLLKAST